MNNTTEKYLRKDEKQEMIWCEEEQKHYPKYDYDEKLGIMYQLDTQTWTYNPIIEVTTDTATKKLLDEPIGKYGRKWQKFMEANNPEMIPHLQGNLRWEIIPREIDKEAEELYQILDDQYRTQNPRPTEFMETAKWEKMRLMEIDHEIMIQIVLQYRE